MFENYNRAEALALIREYYLKALLREWNLRNKAKIRERNLCPDFHCGTGKKKIDIQQNSNSGDLIVRVVKNDNTWESSAARRHFPITKLSDLNEEVQTQL